jgi:hypothetical protein
MSDQKDYEKAFAELAQQNPIPPEVRKQMDEDRLKAEFEDVVKRIGGYCLDFCKKAPPGMHPSTPEKCPYNSCPLYKYRMGKV